jgi:hypothetical protein
MGFARGAARIRSGRACSCSDMGIAGTCGAAATRTAWVRSTPVRAGARMGSARTCACFLATARTCSAGCSSGLGRRRRACAIVGSASPGCTSGGIAIRTRSRRSRSFLGRPRRSGRAIVGSARWWAAISAPDGAFVEPTGPGLERAAAARFRSRGPVIDGLGRGASGVGSATADRRALLERARAGRLGGRA